MNSNLDNATERLGSIGETSEAIESEGTAGEEIHIESEPGTLVIEFDEESSIVLRRKGMNLSKLEPHNLAAVAKVLANSSSTLTFAAESAPETLSLAWALFASASHRVNVLIDGMMALKERGLHEKAADLLIVAQEHMLQAQEQAIALAAETPRWDDTADDAGDAASMNEGSGGDVGPGDKVPKQRQGQADAKPGEGDDEAGQSEELTVGTDRWRAMKEKSLTGLYL